MCLLLLAGFWLPKRIGHLALRGLAGLVFLLYLIYLIDGIVSCYSAGESPINPFLGFLFIGLPSLMFSVLGRFSLRAEPSPEMLASERQIYEESLLRPDWTFYEHHLQRPIPAALRELYADRDLVTDGGFSYDKNIGIGSFEPLNEQCLLDTRDQVGTGVVAIATSDYGDPIYLRPGSGGPDKVYLTFHDGGETIVLADTVAAFLTRLRSARLSSRRED